jgi:uncharacterized protein (DUF58 family)
MQWNNQVWIKPLFKPLVLFSPLLLLIGLYREIPFLFTTGMLILFLYGATLFQFKSASKDLVIDSSRQVYRFFPGDTEHFSLKISHKGKWPSYRGEISFTHRDVISEGSGTSDSHNTHGRIQQTKPFAVYRQTAYSQSVPFVANRRGTSRITNINLRVQDPFQTGTALLTFQPLFPVEFIVYPTPLPVQRIEHLFHQGSGESSRPFALFENDSMPAGYRDYTSGDSFHKLHWKATAKTGKLQTKVFEKTVVYHWTFVYTIQPEHNKVNVKTTEEIEKEISHLAYMCQFAAEKGIPFEVYINFKVPGPLGVYHTETGMGSHHLSKILEGLARIDRSSVTVKPETMWKKIDRNFAGSVPFVILLGYIPQGPGIDVMTKKWVRSGGRIYLVHQNKNEAFLIPYSAREAASC